ELQTVFESAQEDVGISQLAYGFLVEGAARGEQVEHLQCWAQLEFWIPPATDELENLGDEFDFANPAGAGLDVVGAITPGDFAANLGMQRAHRVECAVVEIFSEYEGAGDLFQLAVAFAGERAGLDPGVAFPFAALRDEIVFD